MQVLQRKTEEAAMATKRLKELLEARKSSGRDNSGISLRIATIFCIIINTPNLTALPSFSFFFFFCFLPNTSGMNGTSPGSHVSYFPYLKKKISCLFGNILENTFFCNADDWEIIAKMARARFGSHGACSWSSKRIWKAKSIVCDSFYFLPKCKL